MPKIINHARQRLQRGELALGFGIHHLRSPAVGLIAAAAGFDWLFIDMEHGAISVDDASRLAIAALTQGVTPIVRCCRDALFEATRVLDNGALGVVVPHIDTAAEAEAVVRSFRYPPLGMRSWGGPAAQYGYRLGDIAAAQAELNEAILIVVMIETPRAVAESAAIAAVRGVDCLMIGTSDLTSTMGIAGQIGHPDVRAAYEQVAAACAAEGKYLGMGGVYDEVTASDYIRLGARFILGGSDHAFMMAAAAARARFLRGLLA